MKTLKKLLCGALSLTMVLSRAACGGDAASGEGPVIGICQYGQHGSLDNCREGFLQGLEQAGLVEGTDFEVDYQNANFDDNQATQIGQMFSAEDADLMVGIATNSAIACFNAAEDKDIPVIFTAITDPVGAHLDAGNITGTSDALPVEGQLQLIRALQPDADTIGIVYTTSEANSVYSISVYEELATDYGFTIDAVGVTSQAEVTQAVDTLLSHGVDCLSNLTIDRGTDTIFTSAPVMALFGDLSLSGRKLIVSLALVIVIKLLLDAYFHTKSGLLLRAVGDNATLVTTLAKDRGTVKILGLVISNALVAFGGCIVCHETRSFSATMGTGQLVYGLAAVIIGVSIIHFYTGTRLARGLRKSGPLRFLGSPQGTTAVVLGSVLYKLCIQVAMSLGLPTNMMKLITAALFLLVLVLSGRKGEAIIHA